MVADHFRVRDQGQGQETALVQETIVLDIGTVVTELLNEFF